MPNQQMDLTVQAQLALACELRIFSKISQHTVKAKVKSFAKCS